MHCLFKSDKQLTEQDYQTNWTKIKDTNQLTMQFAKSDLYGGYANASNVLDALATGVVASGFSCVGKTGEKV